MKRAFTVIKGGRPIPMGPGDRTFISGYATDTRLMGVTGLELTWEILRNSRIERFTQVFYLDSEEYGIESYLGGYGVDPEDVEKEKNRMYGALGGTPVSITEKEARFLIQTHAAINDHYSQPLPEGRESYGFLLSPEAVLTLEEYTDLFGRITGGPCEDACSLINYFLMRCTSGDGPGAVWLMGQQALKESFPDGLVHPDSHAQQPDTDMFFKDSRGTLCRNAIQETGTPDEKTFFCESLMEFDDSYHLVTSMIKASEDNSFVVRARKWSTLKISSPEAAMLSGRSEYISVYDTQNLPDEFFDSFADFASLFTETIYENGRLYIDFNDSNDHVSNPVYRINDDIRVIYFLSDSGQLVIMGYSFNALRDAEFRFYLSMLRFSPSVSSRYQFREPVFYEFVRGSYEDFDEFIESLGAELDPE